MADNKLTIGKKIFLTGFMGSGKTTIGKKLAAKLGFTFVDLDHVFEEQQGMSIAAYFEQYGEQKFREQESITLKETPFPGNAIISTGGGTPCFFDHMDWMNRNGLTVYIQMSPKALAQRLEQDANQRPLLQEKRGESLVAFIHDKLRERESFYNQAQIIIEGLSLTPEKLRKAIKALA